MDIYKNNGDRYFVATPETQIDLDLLLNRLDLVSGIGQSLRNHRAELRRLDFQLRGVEQEPVRAPEGHFFAVEDIPGSKSKFEISRYVRRRDAYWTGTREVEFERGTVFIADAICATSSFDWEDAGSVYAYGPDGEIRCRLNPGDYKVKLTPADVLPEMVVNPIPTSVGMEQI